MFQEQTVKTLGTFKPILSALPEPQRALWEELQTTPASYVLYGGTALALRLGHRQSQDFDFFAAEAKDYQDIAALLTAGVGLETILAAGRAVYGSRFDPSRTLRALVFFEDGNLPELTPRTQAQLRNAVNGVNVKELPILASREGLSKAEKER